MLLADIRNYLKKRGEATLQDVAIHFDITPDSARFALDYWQRKGKIREKATRCSSGGCGSGCGGADGDKQTYEWLQRDIKLNWHPH